MADAKETKQSAPRVRDPEKESDDSDSGDEKDEDKSELLLREMLELQISPTKANPSSSRGLLSKLSLSGVAEYIGSGGARNIITMSGAGISVAAGIPDFRSPTSGLYANLREYKLPSPEAIFSLDYFERHPEPFFKLAKKLYPKHLEPTVTHHFVKLLDDKGLLLRHYTQNIDTLERLAGLQDDKLVEAHGTFNTAHCISDKCRKVYSQEWIKEKIFGDVIPHCEKCGALVKPDVVFFGESLPSKFFRCASSDFAKCDLLIIMGTSLTVQPFASLVSRVPKSCPRLLINATKVGNEGTDFVLRLLGMADLDFDSESNVRDVAWIGQCDAGVQLLADQLGWKNDLERLVARKSSTTA